MAFARFLLAALILAVPAVAGAHDPGHDPQAAPPGIESGSRETRALALAALVTPVDLFVDRSLVLAKQAFRSTVEASPRARRLEKEYPGLYASVWAEAEPQLRIVARDGHMILWSRLAAMFEERLTPAEIETLVTFYSAPVGRKIASTTYATIFYHPEIQRLPLSGGPESAASARQQVRNEVREKLIDELTPADKAALLAVGRGIEADRFKAVGDEVQRVAWAWLVDMESTQMARGNRIIRAATSRYMREHPRRN